MELLNESEMENVAGGDVWGTPVPSFPGAKARGLGEFDPGFDGTRLARGFWPWWNCRPVMPPVCPPPPCRPRPC